MSVDPRIIQTLNEMMEARGLTSLVEHEIKKEDIETNKYPVLKNDDLFVIFVDQFNAEFMNKMIMFLDTMKCNHVIVVYFIKSTKPEKSLKDSSEFEIEVFPHTRLLFNINKHVLVPRHRKIITDCPYDTNKMWKIKISDPIVRFHNFKLGDVIEINDGEYRVVVL